MFTALCIKNKPRRVGRNCDCDCEIIYCFAGAFVEADFVKQEKEDASELNTSEQQDSSSSQHTVPEDNE